MVEKKVPTSKKLALFKDRTVKALERMYLVLMIFLLYVESKRNNAHKQTVLVGTKREPVISANKTFEKFATFDHSLSNWKNIIDIIETNKLSNPTAIPIPDIKNDEEDFVGESSPRKIINHDESFEDNDDDEIELKPNKFFLTFSPNERKKVTDFEEDIRIKNKNFFTKSLSLLFAIYLLQTLTLLAIRNDTSNNSYNLFILLFRSGFLVLLGLVKIFSSNLSKRNIDKPITCFCFLYGLLTTLIQGYLAIIHPIQNLEILELMFIYLIGTHFRYLLYLIRHNHSNSIFIPIVVLTFYGH